MVRVLQVSAVPHQSFIYNIGLFSKPLGLIVPFVLSSCRSDVIVLISKIISQVCFLLFCGTLFLQKTVSLALSLREWLLEIWKVMEINWVHTSTNLQADRVFYLTSVIHLMISYSINITTNTGLLMWYFIKLLCEFLLRGWSHSGYFVSLAFIIFVLWNIHLCISYNPHLFAHVHTHIHRVQI